MNNEETLNKEVQDLKNQIANLNSQLDNSGQQLKGVLAQCQASELIISESQKVNVINRTNLILHQDHAKKLDEQIVALKKENAALKDAKLLPAKAA